MRYLISGSLLLALAAIVGCTQQQTADTSTEQPASTTVATFNAHCPIMGGEVTAEGGTTQWNGETVGFCCAGCIDKFEALSDEEKAAALAKADAEPADHDHGEHDHGDHAESKAT